MTVHDDLQPTPLDTLVHDVQNCLNVVGIGLEILQEARRDDALFAEMSASIAGSNRKAVQLLNDYVRAAHVKPAGGEPGKPTSPPGTGLEPCGGETSGERAPDAALAPGSDLPVFPPGKLSTASESERLE